MTENSDDATAATGPSVPHNSANEPAEPTPAAPTGFAQSGSEPAGPDLAEPSSLEAQNLADELPPKEPRRVTRLGALTIGARGIAGLIAVAVAAVAIIGSTVVTSPGYRVTPPAASVTPVSAAQQRVCPGPLLRLGDESGQGATIVSSVGSAATSFQSVPDEATADDLQSTDNTVGVAPQLLTLPPGGVATGDDPALAGSQSQDAATNELSGFAAAECAEPTGDTWLVGGATTVGRTTFITISNPSTVIATVELSIYGPAGEIPAPGADGIVVQPGAQRILSLAGFAPQLASPVVRVQSRGGQIVANLQQSIVRTLKPGGVDIIGATAQPSRSIVIPGVVVSGADAVTSASGGAGFEDLQTVLRMLAPGRADATVTVTITPESGVNAGVASSPVTTFEFELLSREVSDVPLPGLLDGSYTISIESDAPLVAATRVSTITEIAPPTPVDPAAVDPATGLPAVPVPTVTPDAATDFAWIAAAAELGGDGIDGPSLVSVAPGPGPVLHLANLGGTDATVTVASGTDEISVRVPSGASVATPLESNVGVTLTGASALVGSVSYLGDGRISSFRVTAPSPSSTDITIYR